MTTIKDLQKVRALRMRINNLRSRIKLLTDTVSSVSIQLTGMPKGCGESDKLEAYCDKMRDCSFELMKQVMEWEQELERIDGDLKRLPIYEEQICRLYYCDGLLWDEVAERLHFSDTHCRRIRDSALRSLLTM